VVRFRRGAVLAFRKQEVGEIDCRSGGGWRSLRPERKKRMERTKGMLTQELTFEDRVAKALGGLRLYALS
jgi:hypothetical protein